MQTKAQNFRAGLRDGLPICLGYFAVSFAFGIQAAGIGLSVPEAAAVSAANLTSAGQFAALGIIAAGASYLELAFTQLVINLRYFLMSCALSQRLSPDMRFAHRFGIAYGMTDEIFAVSFSRPAPLSPYYSYGLIAAAVPGWVLGTTLGAAAGSILPGVLTNALGIALYGMFIAIVVPPAKENRVVAGVALLSMAVSAVFTLRALPAGNLLGLPHHPRDGARGGRRRVALPDRGQARKGGRPCGLRSLHTSR